MTWGNENGVGYAQPQQGGFQPQPSTGMPQQPAVQQQPQQQPQQGYDSSFWLDRPAPGQQPQQQTPVYGQQPQQQGNLYTPQNFQPQGYGLQQPQGQPQPAPQQPQQLPPQQWGQQTQQPAPGVYGQQQQQFQPRAQPATVQLSDDVHLDGESVPQELRGRTWGEARRLYSALSTEWLQRNRGGGQPQQPQQQLPPQQFGQPQAQAQPQRGANFFSNPDERIAEVVRQELQATVLPALQPMVQQSQANGIMQARNIAATGMQDFQQLETPVMEMLASADPRDLQNPQVWIAAANMVRGQLVATGQYQQGQQRQGMPQPQQQFGPGVSQPASTFFSEGPTAPSMYSQQGPSGNVQPTQTDYHMAQRFGMSINDWMISKLGPAALPQGRF
jgi:hypothetical protein